jgi:hypothetical protein
MWTACPLTTALPNPLGEPQFSLSNIDKYNQGLKKTEGTPSTMLEMSEFMFYCFKTNHHIVS